MKKICAECGKEREIWSFEETCYSCRKNRHLADIKKQILGGEIEETDCETEVICPWCGEIYEIDDDYELYTEGDRERECGYCEKDFNVYSRVSVYYDTSRPPDSDGGCDGEEKHND